MQDSGFDDRSRRHSTGANSTPVMGKENSSPLKRGARKSLAANWTPQSLCRQAESSFTNPETPSKSLLGTDTSMVFSPPSVLKDTMNQSDDSGSGEPGDHDLSANTSCGVAGKTPSHSANEHSPPKSKVRI